MCRVSNVLCEIYGSTRGLSASVDELFERLGEKVRTECGARRTVLRMLGQIDFVMASAEAHGGIVE